MNWQPQPEGLSQLTTLLRDSMSSNNAVQTQVREVMNEEILNGDLKPPGFSLYAPCSKLSEEEGLSMTGWKECAGISMALNKTRWPWLNGDDSGK